MLLAGAGTLVVPGTYLLFGDVSQADDHRN
jgi:hypothetical protein